MSDPFEGLEPADPFEGLEPAEPVSAEPAPPPVHPKVGVAEAAGRGAAGGASMEFSDEAAGAGSASAGGVPTSRRGDFTGGHAGPIERAPDDPSLLALGSPFTAPLAIPALLGIKDRPGYAAMRDQWRQRDAQAAKDRPVAFHGSKIAGALATSAPGGGGGLLGTGARLAAEGSAAGYGASESETAAGQAKDALTGGAVSLATGGALRGAGKLVSKAKPRIQRFAVNRRLAHTGISDKTAREFPAGGREGLVKRMQDQGIGTGIESRQRVLEQAETAVEKGEAARAAAIPDPSAPAPNPAQALRDRSRQFGGEAARDVRRNAHRARAAAAEAEAEQLERQAEALGLNQKFARPDPAEAMRAPTPPTADLAGPKTGAGFKGRKQLERAQTAPALPLTDRRAAPRPQTPAGAMAGPKNARKAQKQIEAKRAEAAQARSQIAPEGELGAGERRILEREASALEPDQLSMGELNARRAQYGKAWQRPNSTADEAEAFRAAHEVSNDLLESEISRANPGMGEAWREAGRNQAAAIRAREGVTEAMAKTDRSPAMDMRGGVAAIALGAPGWVAERMLRGREHAIAAYGAEKLLSVPNSPFGRALRGRNTAGRLAAAASAEDAAREHFIQSGTDPDYHKEAYGTPEE